MDIKLFHVIVVYIDKNATNSEMISLLDLLIAQLKSLNKKEKEYPINIYILGKNPYSSEFINNITTSLKSNADLNDLTTKSIKNRDYETRIQYAEHLMNDIDWFSTYKVIILSLGYQFTKTEILWHHIKEIIKRHSVHRKSISLSIVKTNDTTSFRKILLEFFDVIQTILYFI